MARKRISSQSHRQPLKTTLLVVGEGPDDSAFITHVNRVFRDAIHKKATIKPESGGSPGVIITNATRKYLHRDFDKRLFVLDADIPPDAASIKLASQHGFHIILWSPQCLEGALLDVLGEHINAHETSQDLKARLHPRLAGHHTDPSAYEVLFPKDVLEAAKNQSVVDIRTALISP